MAPNPRDHLRQLEIIDSEINSPFRASLSAPSQCHNELIPISSLPTEIITEIILLASTKRDFGLGWLNVAHVCHKWREIALNQRHFWSHINFGWLTSAGAAEMLARAKDAPLHLELKVERMVPRRNWNHARYSAFDKELQAHVSHIRHLDIVASALESSRFVSTTLQDTLVASPAPILEYLSLSNDDLTGTLSIPNNVFKGVTPKLISLKLTRVMISWTSPLLRGLRYLEIYELNDGNKPSLTDWLDALDEMPQLKELVLLDASPLADGPTFPSHIKRTATLPVLIRLELMSTAWDCALALAHLVLPALTSLSVQSGSSDNSGDDALMLIRYLTQHAHGPQDAKPLQSVLFYSNRGRTRVVAWPTGMHGDIHDIAHGGKERAAHVLLYITCKTSWSTSTSARILDAAIDALPLDDLVTLTVPVLARLDDERVWLRHAPRWPLLEHIQLAQQAARGFREVLLLEDNGGHESPLLPSLRRLDLLGTSLTRRRTLRLCDALKRRVEQGVPLKVLGLCGCYWCRCEWTIDAVRLLRRFVDDVRGPKENTSRQEEGSPAWDPETCDFVIGCEDSDEGNEG